MASQTRRLTDLFVVGKDVTFNDGSSEPLTVFVRKLNAGDHEKALRKANAARSRILSAKSDTESDQYRDQRMLMNEFTVDELVEYLGEDEKQRRSDSIEAELAEDEEWSKDEYLTGLRAAWEDGLKDEWAKDPEEAEANRVYLELKRFADAAHADIAAHVEGYCRDVATLPLDTLQNKVFDKLMDVQASLAWLTEYRACEIWLSVREADKRTPYFVDRDEVDQLPNEVRDGLSTAYRELSVDPAEGKESRQTDTS